MSIFQKKVEFEISRNVLSKMSEPTWNHLTVLELFVDICEQGVRLKFDTWAKTLAAFCNREFVQSESPADFSSDRGQTILKTFHNSVSKYYSFKPSVLELEKEAIRYSRSENIMGVLKNIISKIIPKWGYRLGDGKLGLPFGFGPGLREAMFENLPIVIGNARLERVWLRKYYYRECRMPSYRKIKTMSDAEVSLKYRELVFGHLEMPSENFIEVPDDKYLSAILSFELLMTLRRKMFHVFQNAHSWGAFKTNCDCCAHECF